VIVICKHGTYKNVFVIDKQKEVKVDACIADEITELNKIGVVTLGSCCGHGKAGQPYVIKNGFGVWKGYHEPPSTLIRKESVELAKQLGYRPFPYYYADSKHNGVWQMYLKTGCMTEDEVEKWHKNYDRSHEE
jgi:hypothetical protein